MSAMDWGVGNGNAGILQPQDGRTGMMAVNHGYFVGPTHRLEKPRATIAPLLPYADVVMLTRGVLRTSVDPDADTPIVLRVSGSTSVLQEDLSHETITTSVKEALRLNATAVALSIFIGAPHEHESIVNLAHLVNEGEEVGLPVLAVTAVGKELERRGVRHLRLARRVDAGYGPRAERTDSSEGVFARAK